MQWEHRVLTTDPPEKSQELMIVLKLVYSFLIVLGLRCCLGFSLVVEIQGPLRLWCMSFSLQRFLLLQSTGSRACRLQLLKLMGSVVAAGGL